jgi:hypothetical protein
MVKPIKSFKPGDLVQFTSVVDSSRAKAMTDPSWSTGFKPGEIVVFVPGLSISKAKPFHIEMAPEEFAKRMALLGIDVAEEQTKVEAMTNIIPVVTSARAEPYLDDIKRALQEKTAVITIDSFVEKESDDDG